MKHSTIYKSEEGRRKFQGHYRQALSKLPFDFVEKNFETSFGATNVLIAGPEEAPPVVVMHGVGANAPIALLAISELVKTHRVYAPDMIGQTGRSAEHRPSIKDHSYGVWFEEVLDHLSISQVNIVGVSYGAFVSMKLAAYAPQRISKLILVVPGGIVDSSPWVSVKKVAWPMLKYNLIPSRKNLDQLLDNIFTDPEGWHEFQADIFKYVDMDMRKPPLVTKAQMESLQAPVYVLGADEDVFFPGEQVIKRAKEVFPNFVEGSLLPNCKHAPPVNYPPLNAKLAVYLNN